MADILAKGVLAPSFTLNVTPDQTLSLSEFAGRRVILAFYPADWSPVCGDQMTLYNHILPEFRRAGAELLGISVDGAWCHQAFAREHKLHFAILSDFEPKGAVAKSYGAYRDKDGVCERALFLIDESGMIAWAYRSPLAVNPGADGILDALEALPPWEKKNGQLKVPVTSADHVQGSEDPTVTLVEYGDYECPHCAAAQSAIKQIVARYGSDLRFAYRHFPLVEIHPHARPAAEAAEFAGSQGLFWPMHEAIFANQHRLSVPLLIAAASNLKLSAIALRDALAAERFTAKVEADFMGGVRSGVNGTPTFFVNGWRHDSPYGAASLPAVIDQAIAAAAAGQARNVGERRS